jgi:hypothetical protein
MLSSGGVDGELEGMGDIRVRFVGFSGSSGGAGPAADGSDVSELVLTGRVDEARRLYTRCAGGVPSFREIRSSRIAGWILLRVDVTLNSERDL